MQFLDVTRLIEAAVQQAGLHAGIVTVQTRHTTTGILVNEYEPLLLADFRALFERLAPARFDYAHDDFLRRTVNLTAGRTARTATPTAGLRCCAARKRWPCGAACWIWAAGSG